MTGSRVRGTRWKRHWLYGELVQDGAGQARVRGWFPRQCAVEVVDHRDCCSGTQSRLLLCCCNPASILLRSTRTTVFQQKPGREKEEINISESRLLDNILQRIDRLVIFSNFYYEIKISQKYQKLNCELFIISCCLHVMRSTHESYITHTTSRLSQKKT